MRKKPGPTFAKPTWFTGFESLQICTDKNAQVFTKPVNSRFGYSELIDHQKV
jgi:hypothetical protein